MAKAVGRFIDGVVVEETISGTWKVYDDDKEIPVYQYCYGISCSYHGWNGNTSQQECRHVALVKKYIRLKGIWLKG